MMRPSPYSRMPKSLPINRSLPYVGSSLEKAAEDDKANTEWLYTRPFAIGSVENPFKDANQQTGGIDREETEDDKIGSARAQMSSGKSRITIASTGRDDQHPATVFIPKEERDGATMIPLNNSAINFPFSANAGRRDLSRWALQGGNGLGDMTRGFRNFTDGRLAPVNRLRQGGNFDVDREVANLQLGILMPRSQLLDRICMLTYSNNVDETVMPNFGVL